MRAAMLAIEADNLKAEIKRLTAALAEREEQIELLTLEIFNLRNDAEKAPRLRTVERVPFSIETE